MARETRRVRRTDLAETALSRLRDGKGEEALDAELHRGGDQEQPALHVTTSGRPHGRGVEPPARGGAGHVNDRRWRRGATAPNDRLPGAASDNDCPRTRRRVAPIASPPP